MKHLKKSVALLLALCMVLSTLTCMAMAADDEEETVVTVYVTCDEKELRPGDTIVDVNYTISPVENLTSFSLTVSVPDGMEFDKITRHGSDLAYLQDLMFDGEGAVTSSGTRITGSGGGESFTCNENFYLFSARYNVLEDAEEGEVTFGLDSVSFGIRGAKDVEVDVVTEPINIVIVDSSALERQVSSAESILGSKGLYSDRSFAALEEALADAEKILDNIHDYYQDDVDRALVALTEAYDGLKTPAEEVNAAIESAGQLRESDYTADSWAAMTEALDAAKDIRDSGSATSEDLNAAADTLYDAIDALVLVDDPIESSRKALEQLVQEAKELNESDYSESTWTALQTAIETAENVLDNDDATKEELDDAYDALALAMSRAQLEKTIEMAKLLSESDYDADSWAALQAAIEAAEAVLNDENATKQELDDAYDALIEAMNAGNSSNTYPYGTNTNNGNGDTGSSGGIVTSPQTGDSNILLMCMILLAAGMGTCAVACASKAHRAKE